MPTSRLARTVLATLALSLSVGRVVSAQVLYDNSKTGQSVTGGLFTINLSNSSSADYTTARSECSAGGGYAGGTILLRDVKFIRVKILSGTVPTNMQIGGHSGTGTIVPAIRMARFTMAERTSMLGAASTTIRYRRRTDTSMRSGGTRPALTLCLRGPL
ncbi:MAG: hypothetical protein AABN95_26870 [Acidobacteriota bacterium]